MFDNSTEGKRVVATLIDVGLLNSCPSEEERTRILMGIKKLVHVVRREWRSSDAAIGELLKEMRERHEISQERLRLGINKELGFLVDQGVLLGDQTSISKIETGKQSLKFLHAMAIARTLTGSTEGVIHLSPWQDDRMRCLVVEREI